MDEIEEVDEIEIVQLVIPLPCHHLFKLDPGETIETGWSKVVDCPEDCATYFLERKASRLDIRKIEE